MARLLQPDGRFHGVVAGIRDSTGRYLAIRRAPGIWAGGMVCFPGGAIEPGETQSDALVRELREELGIEIYPIQCVWKWESLDASDPDARQWLVYPIPLTLWGWMARIVGGDLRPDPAEIAECFWLHPDEILSRADGLPTNQMFLAALAAASR